MSTWNVITITEAPDLTEQKMQKAPDRAGVDLSDLTLDQDSDRMEDQRTLEVRS